MLRIKYCQAKGTYYDLYIADYKGRSVNSYVLVLIRENIGLKTNMARLMAI